MHRLTGLVVIGALAVVVGAVAAGPAAAAKGGNNDTAKLCQKGGWNTLVSHSGDSFANVGDCVNDGAHGLGVQPAPLDPLTVCEALTGGTFTAGSGDGDIWDCQYESPPEPQQPQSLSDACARSGGGLLVEPLFGHQVDGMCTQVG